MERTRIAIVILALVAAHAGAAGQTNAEASQNRQTPAVSPSSGATPSTVPVVTFRNGELSIAASNSTLCDILEMVRARTGAVIDIPPGADVRVFDQLGPGPARKILDSLLQDSGFNFVIVSLDSDPQAIAAVVLSPKGAPTPVPPASIATANLPPPAAPGTEESGTPEVAQMPSRPAEGGQQIAEDLSSLASSVVRRASFHQ